MPLTIAHRLPRGGWEGWERERLGIRLELRSRLVLVDDVDGLTKLFTRNNLAYTYDGVWPVKVLLKIGSL